MSAAGAILDPVAPAKVAIVMRSMNEHPYAEPALRGLERQTFRDWALYNVDSGSTDGTLEVVRAHNPDPGRVVQIPPAEYVPGRVLNRMIARTEAPFVVLQNADAIPCDDRWLETLVEPLFAGEADATMSAQVARPSASFIVRYDYERAYDPRNIKGDNASFFSAVACAFRRTLWEKTPFHEEGYAEDLAWSKACQDAGARFRLVPESVVEHSHDYSLGELHRKRYRHGLAYVRIFGDGPRLLEQSIQCVREVGRDTLHALCSGRPDTIPYNTLYRAVTHVAYFRGKKDGTRRAREARST